MFGKRVDALEGRITELETLLMETRAALDAAAHQGTDEAQQLLMGMEQIKRDQQQLAANQQELSRANVTIAAEVAKHSNTFARLLGGLNGVVSQFITPPATTTVTQPPQGKVGPAGVYEASAVSTMGRESRRTIKRQQQRDLRKGRRDGSSEATG